MRCQLFNSVLGFYLLPASITSPPPQVMIVRCSLGIKLLLIENQYSRYLLALLETKEVLNVDPEYGKI